MDSLYGKIFNFIMIWFAFSNLILTNVAIAEHDYEPSHTSNEHDSYGLSAPSNFYVNKKLSEFLGGPGRKRFDSEDHSNYYLTKRLSEFLGGPGKKRFDSSRIRVDKKLSEFLGGPGK